MWRQSEPRAATYMDLTTTIFQDGEEPEILYVNFPDTDSQGEDPRACPFQSPRKQWLALATEKAKELGLEFGVRHTKEGLAVAFRNGGECNALLTAMQPDWHGRLMEGLKAGFLYAELYKHLGDDKSLRDFHIEESAEKYALSPEDVADLYAHYDTLS